MMLRDAQRNNQAISGALFAGLAVSMIIITAFVRITAITIRAGARAIKKGN
ncbi:hypothetical protein [Paracoccus sp. J55]|uniref:hypothetical protein n=1 Tax=Paracoccus sp. J55 TaxID=935849 RepID=UPI0004B60D85|nr:hypothetical protein [Paracoccus sp. J55]